MKFVHILVLAAGVAGLPLRAADPSFEVASVKPNSGGGRGMSINRTPGGRFSTENVPLRFLITFAYDVRDFQVSGGPGWMNDDRWDISAKPDGDVPQGPEGALQIRAMTRSLLADRFQLAMHEETKELPVYALVVGKNGPKIQPSPEGSKGCNIRAGRDQATFTKCTTQSLAQHLSSQLGRIVIDETGLKGDFDMKLQYAPDTGSEGMRKGLDGHEGAPAAEAEGPSIFTAVQEQLGLRLEGKKGPVKILVIDKAERPSEN